MSDEPRNLFTYSYTTSSGKIVDLRFPCGEAPQTFTMPDGETVTRDVAYEVAKGGHSSGNWPMYSDAMGCNPDQIPEMAEHSVRVGVPTQFDDQGRAILTSPRHRKEYGMAIGLYDRNAGHSDPTPDDVRRRERNDYATGHEGGEVSV
jgi:hypothetical protein